MVLIISQSAKRAAAYRDMLYYMGIPSETMIGNVPHNTALRYRMGLIISDDREIEKEYIKRLKLTLGKLPLFSVGNAKNEDGVLYAFPKSATANEIIKKGEKMIEALALTPVCEYALFGIDASAKNESVSYFGKRIHLTKSELLILRTLIAAYPSSLKASEILKIAFKESRAPMASSVRTHISMINKRFNLAFDNKIIFSENGGYKIKNPNKINEPILA